MVTTVETRHRDTRSWNFGTRQSPHSLEDFLAWKSQDFKFFEGSEPWVGDHDRVTWENFFRSKSRCEIFVIATNVAPIR